MKVYHLSDTHGLNFWRADISDCDLVIHSGDLLPDFARHENIQRQIDWLEERSEEINKWLGQKNLLYVPGNHDFVELEDFISNAIRLSNHKNLVIDKHAFAGYREVPPINGQFAGEAVQEKMLEVVSKTFSLAPSVLVTHTPAKGILGNDGQEWGCRILRSALDANIYEGLQHHFFGHVHLPEPKSVLLNGIWHHNGTRENYSNANGNYGHKVSI
jgi:Icc-related predicted phosphoesterase